MTALIWYRGGCQGFPDRFKGFAFVGMDFERVTLVEEEDVAGILDWVRLFTGQFEFDDERRSSRYPEDDVRPTAIPLQVELGALDTVEAQGVVAHTLLQVGF